MTWNYRVFVEENGDYVIREVFYDADGAPVACTQDAVEPYGESLEELARDLEWFREALEKPVLTLADIPSGCGRDRASSRDRRENLSTEQLIGELGLAEPAPA